MSTQGAGRVALFHPSFETPGGAEILVATAAQYLTRSGLGPCVATLKYDAAQWQGLLEGIPVRVAEPSGLSERYSSHLRQLRKALPRAQRLLADCEVVMAVNAPCNALLGALPIAARKVWWCTEPWRALHLVETSPTIFARVSSVPDGSSAVERNFRTRFRWHVVQRHVLRRALRAFDIEQTNKIESIYAISEFARDCVHRVYDRGDARVISPIVRFPQVQARPRAGLDRSGLKILVHTRLELIKNVESVLRGFALFHAKHGSAQLHVVGAGKQREALEELARGLGIAQATRFHGWLSDAELAAVYAACDVFALLPLDEPFGMVFPEAAARGLLLVGPNQGGPMEILDGGRLGWLCDPFEPEALADTFARIEALSDAEVDSRRERADEACRSRYSEQVVGPALERALRG